MLTALRLAAFGVVDEAELELGPGLTALTGETGAGKTMLVAGLGHLLGSRADPGIVRRGRERAVVEGRWNLPGPLLDRVRDLGGDSDDDEVVALRQISTQGRSRAMLGGVGVPVAALGDLLGEVATIHGQSGQVRLSTTERQREVLDAHARPAELGRYRDAYAERQRAAAELAGLRGQAMERAREEDLLRFGLAEIESIAPQPGEDDALSAEQARLMDLDELRLRAARAHGALSGSETDFDAPSAVALIGQARKALAALAERDEAVEPLVARAVEAAMLTSDLAADVAGYLDDLVSDPLRLEAVGQRRAQLASLTRKYGPTVDDVLRWAAAAADRLQRLVGSDERIVELASRVAELDDQLAADAAAISAARRSAAIHLERLVKAELSALAMPHAQLRFDIEDAPLGPFGADRIELLFSANPGSALAPLGKVASGGELSRIRLALEVVLADGSSEHTFVFDEVDAGIGGAVGLEIGRRLQRLAATSQVIVVTHLAQVAAFADAHFAVHKSSQGEVTTSGVRRLGHEERVAELARMMGGEATSSKGLDHATELLARARRS